MVPQVLHDLQVGTVLLGGNDPTKPLRLVQFWWFGYIDRSDGGTISANAVKQADLFDAPGMLNRQGSRNRSSPVLADKGNVVQVQLLDQGNQIVDMGFERVLAILGGFAFTEAHVVGNNDSPTLCEYWNELAIDVSPGWLAMQENNRVATAFVNVVHAKSRCGCEIWLEREGSFKRLICCNHGRTIIGCLLRLDQTSHSWWVQSCQVQVINLPIRVAMCFFRLIGFVLVLALPAVVLAAGNPNFIILFADDQGWGDLGVYGHPDIRTPNIDRMAAEGMRFTSFYAAPFCGPSRAALMTGSYPPRAGLDFNHGPQARTGIHSGEITLAELLKQQGYATTMIGKWHLGDAPQFLPHRNGFDHWLGIPFSNDMWRYHPMMPIREPEDERMISARERADMTGFAGRGSYYDLEKGQGFPHPLPLMQDGEVLEFDPDQRKLTTVYTEKAVEFIEENRENPFFLYLPYAMPHVPLFVSNDRWGKSRRGRYGDVIEELDWSVGQILDKLRELDLAENTMVVYTSDNGPWLQYGIDAGSAGPFKLGKSTTWEGGMRVPGIFWMPGSIPAGQVSSAVVANMDIFPTFAALAGAVLPADRVLDGRDLWPLLSGASNESPHKYFYYFHGSGPSRPTRLEGIRMGRYKLRLRAIESGGLEAVHLYDLNADAGEKFDISSRHPELVDRLLAQAKNFLVELKAGSRPLGTI